MDGLTPPGNSGSICRSEKEVTSEGQHPVCLSSVTINNNPRHLNTADPAVVALSAYIAIVAIIRSLSELNTQDAYSGNDHHLPYRSRGSCP